MRTYVLGALLCLAPWLTQDGEANEPATPPVAQARLVLNIPAQSLTSALEELSHQAGVQILHRDAPGGDEPRTREIKGTFSLREALDRLLSETGYRYELVNDRTVRVWADAKRTATEHGNTVPTDPPVAPTDSKPVDSSGAEPSESLPGRSPTKDSRDQVQEVIVTGTHIRGVSPASPLLEITSQDIVEGGFAGTPSLISSLPQNFNGGGSQVLATGVFGGEFSRFVGTTTPSLRGLGDATLTLVDGHRLPRTGGANGSDISAIPIAALDHVDVVTDGASAIYGSDAIAGVLNFVLKHDYRGLQLSASLDDPTRSGGGKQQAYSGTGGATWGGGNAMLSCEYRRLDALFTSDRDFSTAAPNSSTLIPEAQGTSCAAFLQQHLGRNLTADFNAIYAHRTGTSAEATTSTNLFSNVLRADQYALNGGLTYEVGNWTAELDGNLGQDSEGNVQDLTSSGVEKTNSISNRLDREYSVEFNSSGALAELPGGVAKAAVGGGFRREETTLNLPLKPSAGLTGSRRVGYVYGETQIPIVHPDGERTGMEALDVNLSGRYDHYSDSGGTTNPQVGLVYTPIKPITLRGTFGTSFRAPLLTEQYQADQGLLFLAHDPRFPTGAAPALVLLAGNPSLRPERSTEWTGTLDIHPAQIPGFLASTTYFNYDFRDKILQPITVSYFSLPLSNPGINPFTTFNPSSSLVQSLADGISSFLNLAGPKYSVSDTQAILDNRYTNVSVWRADGVDLTLKYLRVTAIAGMDLSFNGTYLHITERPNPTLGETKITGVLFQPPKFRLRTGGSFSRGPWSVSTFLNYVGGSTTQSGTSAVEIGSFSTIDVQLSFSMPTHISGPLAGTRFSIGAYNVFDRDPPHLPAALLATSGFGGYDSANASPYGRLLFARIAKEF